MNNSSPKKVVRDVGSSSAKDDIFELSNLTGYDLWLSDNPNENIVKTIDLSRDNKVFVIRSLNGVLESESTEYEYHFSDDDS